MSHRLDRGEMIDMLEESILKHIPVVVELDNNHTFEDRVKQIFADGGEDQVEVEALGLHAAAPATEGLELPVLHPLHV